MGRYVLAIDVGGTFTDVICFDEKTGAAEIAKASSTPPDFIDGMINGITTLGIDPAEISLIKIGTTIATNTIIMRTGARTALVTTAGFTDVLHAARASRPTLYDSDWDPAPALVSRRDTHTVRQRTTYDGEVIENLDEAGMRAIAAELRDQGTEAVAICFLHSYINGDHERRAQGILQAEIPDAYVCISSDILPEIREFERTSTTVANAYLGPVLDRYLSALAERLEAFGYNGIWFGIIVTKMTEVAVLTPPLGLNVYAVQAMGRQMGDEMSLGFIFKNAAPFLLMDFLMLAILIVFPDIVTWLPNIAYGTQY